MKIKNLLRHLEEYQIDFVEPGVLERDITTLIHGSENINQKMDHVLYYGKPHELVSRINGQIFLTYEKSMHQYGCECNFILLPEHRLDESVSRIVTLLEQEPILIRYKNELLEGILEKKTLKEILKMSFRYLKNPIMVTDSRYRLVELYPDKKLNEPVWDSIREKGYADQELMNQIESDHTKDEVLKRTFPFFITWGFAANFPRIGGKISDGRRFYGVIGVLETYGPFRPIDLDLVDCLCQVVQRFLQNTNPPTDDAESYKNTLLSNLIDGALTHSEDVKEAFRIGGIKWRPPFRVISIPVDLNQMSLMILKRLQEEIQQSLHHVQTTMHQSYLVLLMHQNENDQNSAKLEEILVRYQLECGLSNGFQGLTQANVHYEQSVLACQYGIGKEKVRLHYFVDHYERHFFRTMQGSVDARLFYHPGVSLLIQYDQEHQSNFVETLFWYLVYYKNLNHVAQHLHVHRNTLTYRLSKIEDLLGVSLDDNATCRHLHLSLLMEKSKNVDS